MSPMIQMMTKDWFSAPPGVVRRSRARMLCGVCVWGDSVLLFQAWYRCVFVVRRNFQRRVSV